MAALHLFSDKSACFAEALCNADVVGPLKIALSSDHLRARVEEEACILCTSVTVSIMSCKLTLTVLCISEHQEATAGLSQCLTPLCEVRAQGQVPHTKLLGTCVSLRNEQFI